MKKTMKQGCLLLLAVMMAALASCSDKKTADLLDIAGDDAVAVVMIKPVELLKSCDATIENGKLVLPPALKRNMGNNVNEILKIEGIDYELCMIAAYDGYPRATVAVQIKDADALASSLRKLGYAKQTLADVPVFTGDEANVAFVVKENTLMAFESWNSSRLESDVENVLDRATSPMATWKKDAIMKNSSNTIYGLGMVDEKQMELSVPFAVNFDGPRMRAEAVFYDLDGKTIDWTELLPVDLKTIGEEASFISSKDCLAFAFGGAEDNLNRVINKYDFLSYFLPYRARRNIDEDMMKSLTGGFFGSINVIDPSSRRFDRLSSYNAVAGVTTVEGKGVRLLKDIVGQLKDAGAPIKSSSEGYTFRIPEQGTIEAFATDNAIVIATEEKSPNSTLSRSALDDCYFWAAVNIPAGFAPLKEFGVKVGLKGECKVKADNMKLELEFVGSDLPFIATILDIVNRK